jgi:hypothetical protein
MLELRDTVVKDLQDYPNLMLLDKLYATDFEMIIYPLSGKTKVITVINTSARLRNNPLNFTFAIYDKDYYLPSEVMFDSLLPDISVPVGQPILIEVRCNKLLCDFSDNTILFEIERDFVDTRRAYINFTPSALDIGEYNITITVNDGIFSAKNKFHLSITT